MFHGRDQRSMPRWHDRPHPWCASPPAGLLIGSVLLRAALSFQEDPVLPKVLILLGVWLALAAGLFSLPRRPRLLVVLGCGLLALSGANISYWNGVYDANLDHMVSVRIEAARYVLDTIPPDELCAGLDIGALRYFTGRPIVDLGGLVDPDIRYWHEQGGIDSYLVGQGTTCLILPGCPGWEDKGWLDPLRMMGLSTSPLFQMKLVQEFHIDYLRWLQ